MVVDVGVQNPMRRVHLEEGWLVQSFVEDIEMDCYRRVSIFESLKQTQNAVKNDKVELKGW